MAVNNQIGSGAIVLTTSAGGLVSGLAQAENDVKAWGIRTSEAVKSGPLAGGGLLGSLFKGGAIGAGLAIGAAAVNGIVGLAEAAIQKYHSLGEGIDKASKSARALGTDMATFQGIAHAADLSGVGVEELEAGLARLRRQVSGPLDTALYGFAQRLEGIEDPGERARLLVENFGKSGLKLAGLFEGGKSGLEDMVAEAKRLGLALSDADGKAIEEANDSITRAKRSIDGLWNKVVVALAPAFEYAGKAITEAMVRAQPVFDWIGRAISRTIQILEPMFDEIGSGISAVTQEIAGWGVALPSIETVVVEAFRAMAIGAGYFWDAIKLGLSPAASVFGMLVEGLGKVVDAFKESVRSILEVAAKIPAVISPIGPLAAMALKDFDKLGGRMQDLGKQMQEWGKRAWMGFGSGAAEAEAWFNRLLERMKKRPPVEPKKLPGMATESSVAKLAGAIEARTKESYEISLRARGFDVGDTNALQRKANEKLDLSNKLAEKQDEKLGRIAGMWEGSF